MGLFKQLFDIGQASSLVDETVAVIDVETTGLFSSRDRIIEIAIVQILPDGKIQTEYETLVNPNRDIGPTSKHGITAGEVLKAPTFADIAGDVLAILSNATVIAGHNISFDKRFIDNEFQRIGVSIPDVPMLCTCNLFGRNSLTMCCKELGIAFEGTPHRALFDARNTARLVSQLYNEDNNVLRRHRISNQSWPVVKATGASCFTRDHSQALINEPPRFLQRIAEKMHHDSTATNETVIAYETLIDRILEDRIIDINEEDILVDAVLKLKLSQSQINQAHAKYIHSLAVLALADGVVSESELCELRAVARLLGQDLTSLDDILKCATTQLAAVMPKMQKYESAELVGKRVCFTGELQTLIGGIPLTRDMAEALAEKAGLQVANSVSKKLDILVVADPNTQSGKARKARDYGIRIITDTVFWRMIGVSVD